MAEFQRVPIARPPFRNWLPTIGASLGLFLLIVIAKPWAGPAASAPSATRVPATAAAARPTERSSRRTYDPRLFGGREPDPAWELWPAGYVVEFGMAGPLPVQSPAATQPGSSRPTSPPTSPRSTVTAPSPATGDPWVVDLGPADHLIALGINTPAEVTVMEIGLWILRGDGCCPEAVPFVSLPTPWESRHFMVIGVEDPDHPGDAGPWEVGEYRLDLALLTGEVRGVRFRVTEPLG